MKGKVIIISAPSGCGKSTIIKAILDKGEIDLKFSVSATNRSPRQGEQDGVHYHFLTDDEFRRHIEAGDFVEFEEVYAGRFYGTLRSEIENVCESGHNCVLDIDVKGAVNVKRLLGDRAMSIFIMPPSIDALRSRLLGRATDSAEEIARRVDKAAQEIEYAPEFDNVVVNDILPDAVAQVESKIKEFVAQ
nr:guanylate kinase [Bacteroides sp.]